jgi:hypothetical protein
MAKMTLEIWQEPDGGYCGCFAGPMGDEARALLAPGATIVHCYEAESHFEAATRYHELLGFEPYRSPWEALDRRPYAVEWAATQLANSHMLAQSALARGRE